MIIEFGEDPSPELVLQAVLLGLVTREAKARGLKKGGRRG